MKMTFGKFQDGINGGPQMSQEAHDGSKWLRHAHKEAPRAPKMAPRAFKIAPGTSKMVPGWLLKAPTCPKESLKSPQ